MSTEKPISEINSELYEKLANKTLSFGCKLRDRGGEVFYIEENGDYLRIHNGTEIMDLLWTGVEIIGHEPTLNDVLLGIIREGKCYNFYPSMEEEILIIRVYYSPRNMKHIVVHYDLTKSFDNQEEETKRKLHELLCTDTK